ncbi:hypothetical protein Syun_014697 [Stephania yunnanensis]|uniref:Uncharacterized protein n=1 Tax=Stephania yunnanensis TaxID=152371 RepID=A0AAP0P918_9MAGN
MRSAGVKRNIARNDVLIQWQSDMWWPTGSAVSYSTLRVARLERDGVSVEQFKQTHYEGSFGLGSLSNQEVRARFQEYNKDTFSDLGSIRVRNPRKYIGGSIYEYEAGFFLIV